MSEKKPVPKKPRWCDLDCRAAKWPDETGLDGSGSCRTFIGLECQILKRIVSKNAPCAVTEKDYKKKIVAFLES